MSSPLPKGEKYRRLLEACRDLPPVATAMAHPCDAISLESAVEAQRLGLIRPLLFGPEARVRRPAGRPPGPAAFRGPDDARPGRRNRRCSLGP